MRISDVHSLLVSTYHDWGGFLANPRFARIGDAISWAGRTGTFLPDLVRSTDILTLVEHKQYTFQTLDNGSILQFYYEFDRSGNEVRAASLAYYGSPNSLSEEEGFPQDQNEDFSAETSHVHPHIFMSWLRIDFNPQTAHGVLHHDCHLHVGGFPNSRLMVRRLPSPKQFVEFVVAACHPEQYRAHRLNSAGEYLDSETIKSINDDVFTCEDHALYDYLMHVATPGQPSAKSLPIQAAEKQSKRRGKKRVRKR
jgi:hypothetical protein